MTRAVEAKKAKPRGEGLPVADAPSLGEYLRREVGADEGTAEWRAWILARVQK